MAIALRLLYLMCAAVIRDAAMPTAAVPYAEVVSHRCFHTDTEALCGGGDRGRNNQPDVPSAGVLSHLGVSVQTGVIWGRG